MRQEQTIRLDETRTVTVRELRPRDVKRLMTMLNRAKKDGEEVGDILGGFDPVNDLFGDHYEKLIGLLGECIIMPEGETVEDLGFSEIDSLIKPLKEVNTSFLSKLKALGLNVELRKPQELSETSTAAPSDSSSADTATSGTTAGDSSKPVLN